MGTGDKAEPGEEGKAKAQKHEQGTPGPEKPGVPCVHGFQTEGH